jgi:hypothetical protein
VPFRILRQLISQKEDPVSGKAWMPSRGDDPFILEPRRRRGMHVGLIIVSAAPIHRKKNRSDVGHRDCEADMFIFPHKLFKGPRIYLKHVPKSQHAHILFLQ